jgi:hypothetical protein
MRQAFFARKQAFRRGPMKTHHEYKIAPPLLPGSYARSRSRNKTRGALHD